MSVYFALFLCILLLYALLGVAASHAVHTLIGFGLNDDGDYTANRALTFSLWAVSQTHLHGV